MSEKEKREVTLNDNDANPKKGKKDKDKKKEEPEIPPIPYFRLYRYATTWDKLMLLAAVVAAAGSGLSMPLMTIFFGRMTKTMVGNEQANSDSDYLITFCKKHSDGGIPPCMASSSTDPPSLVPPEDEPFIDKMRELVFVFIYIGIGTIICNFIFVSLFNIVAENQVFRLRKRYLKALLRQNVGWYDTVPDKNFVSRIAEDLVKVQDAMGEKVGLCIFFMSTTLLSIGTAFWHGWKLTLVVLCSAPVLAIAASIVASIQSKVAATEQDSYAKAGNVAQEAITNIKTVMAFGGGKVEIERYEAGLEDSKIAGKKRGAVSSFGMGLMWLIIYASYALAFWYGTKLIIDGREQTCKCEEPDYDSEKMIVVFFSVMMGAFNMGQAASYFENFATGKGAGASIFQIIDRQPEIDSYTEQGKKPKERPSGSIRFKDVDFHYPSRPDIQILKKFNLSIESGQTVALVGHSGCGKSTCIQLLQRFYDPLSGFVSLDGDNIKDLHIGWLRSQIGVVSQEPVLFNCSISENIRYGRDGVTQEEIEQACRQSNAHAFISKLPNKYETLVGDRGAALSGGQKQRIAIARALVRNPAILLLDEATSALDTQSEAIVQAALDRARLGRTTLIVAHRLSTIRNADVVVVINDGQVGEQGTHRELLKLKGIYHTLVTAQMQGREDEMEAEMEDVEGDKQKRKMLSEKQFSTVSQSGDVNVEEELPMELLFPEDSLSEKELAKQAPISRIMKLNMNEWPYIVVGIIAAAVQGSAMPLYAIIFGEVLQTLSKPDEDEVQKNANNYALMFLGIGLVAGLSMFVQLFMFSLAGDALTQRLRSLTFAAMLRQELGWYDNPLNNIGALCARLSGDAAAVQGATGSRVGLIVQGLSTITIAISLAMYYKAKLGAVALAFVPLVAFATYFQGKLLFGANMGEKKAVEESSKIAVQAISNIRTVASLTREKAFCTMYNTTLQGSHDATFKLNLVRGFVFGFSQSVPFFAYAAVNYYGSWLVDNEGLPYGSIFKVSQALILGTMMLGQALAFAPNYNSAKISGARVLQLLDRQPKIDDNPAVGLQMKSSRGHVTQENICFHYPTRPSAKILKNLSMSVEPGTSVALVGPSGCGKSTTIQLILRFYDPINGEVRLDEQDVAGLQLNSLRSQMAIVAQEPALFDRTIRENIAYGDNSRSVSMDEIIASAKMANIHTFIANLTAGYETRVGEMGTQLSGGQKQRVAIARALVRNPKILLLDEATSALDTESEQVVQQALDQASTGRTSITIAHRLTSIQNVDKIIVINHGAVEEYGSHSELLKKKGLYHRLWNMQGNSSGT